MECLDASAMLASQSMNASRISTTSSCASEDFYHSHPKLEKLEEIVLQHFKSRETFWLILLLLGLVMENYPPC